MQRTSTSQAHSDTIDCQRRDILLYSGLKECRCTAVDRRPGSGAG